ncbi:hypothetical protein RHD99_00915 [Buttiauxella selenatireducens]|uniref:O-antigen polymerase n=1 Tax=Buttiauxella selenatireducens TaxID=3073902 RepID=A0ABY9SB40_9ENTR|nr:hypothetical protein [Buttiauxella sp. R73]WMY74578.1 hypothetical protein RHD99_00915 [Buttiauxella sp. R73]
MNKNHDDYFSDKGWGVNFCSLAILCLGVIFQIGGLIEIRMLSVGVGAIISLILIFIFNSIKHIRKDLLFLLFIGLLHTSVYLISENELTGFYKSLLSFIVFFLSAVLFYSISDCQRKKVFNLIKFSTLLFCSIELFLRMDGISGSLIDVITANFYLLKINSPFFSDTNGFAIYLLPLVIMIIFECVFNKSMNFINIIIIIFLHVFLVLSMSRAVLVSMLFFYMVMIFFMINKTYRYIMVMLVIILLMVISPMLISLLEADGSGLTKVEVYKFLFTNIGTDSFAHILFGFGEKIGAYRYSFSNGSYAHGQFPLLVGMSGMVGTFIYIMFGLVVTITGGKNVLYLLIPIFIVGLSYFPPYFETTFFALGYLWACKYNPMCLENKYN